MTNAQRPPKSHFKLRAMLLASAAVIAIASDETVRANPLSPTASDPGVTYTGLGTSNTDIGLDKQRTIIDWRSFNISSGETTRFFFGGNSWIVLNRVPIGSASIDGNLFGCLDASCASYGGNIWVYAADGVLIGPNARVNAGGFLATTSPLATSDSDFLASSESVANQFDFGSSISDSSIDVGSGAQINAANGSVALVAPQVTTAAGSSVSASGTVLYGAAQSYRIKFAQNSSDDLDLVNFEVPAGRAGGTDSSAPIGVGGSTIAGKVFIASVSKADVANAIIDVSGSVIATSATARDGDIVLSGDGDVNVSGRLSGSNVSVSSTGGTTAVSGSLTAQQSNGAGGSITVTAPNVVLTGTSQLNASGTTGGTILVGGDVHGGANPSEDFSPTLVATANTTTVADGAAIKANGTAGAGGKVVVWSNSNTNFAGSVSATGNGGDGGFVETSGASLVLGQTAFVDTRSVGGKIGNWLLDPATNWDIAISGGDETPTQVVTALHSSNLTIAADNNITVTDPIDATTDASATGSLAFQAGNSIFINAGITLNGGSFTATANDWSDLGTALADRASGNGVFQMASDTTIDTSVGSKSVTITVEGMAANTASPTPGADFTPGAITLSDVKGGSLLVNGAANLVGSVITTTGTQEYGGAVTLGADSDLTGSTVTFDSTVDGAHALTATGNAVFGGEVGQSTNLTSVHVTGTSAINTDKITTTGTQAYDGAATLGSDTNLTGTTVTLGSTLDGAYALTITGDAVFDGEVGGTTAVTTLLVTGTTDINTDTVDTTGTQEYTGAVGLTADTSLTGTSVTFDSTVDGAHALTVTGNGTFGGEVGQTTNLSSLHVTGTSAINTDKITTTGTQAYDGAATLGSDTNLTGTTVTFGSTVDGAYALTITGDAVFDGEIGGTTAVTTLLVTGATDINTDKVDTSGTQEYTGAVALTVDTNLTATSVKFDSTVDGAHALTVTGNGTFGGEVGQTTNLSSLHVTGTSAINTDKITTTGTQAYDGAVTLGSDTNLTGTTVNFGSTLDGANALTITGDAVFDDEVGGTTAVTTLLVTGATDINTDEVDTSGTQEYAGAVALTADTNLNGTSVTFDSTVDGAHVLTVTGNGTFGGEVGQTTNLTSLHVTGTSAINTDKITTTGTQAYDGAATLGSDTNLTGSTVTFGSTVDGAHALTVNATAGAVTFLGAVGSLTPLQSLKATAGSTISGGAVAVTSSLDLEAGTTITFAGPIGTPLLTGSSNGDASFTGANTIAQLGNFTTHNGNFTLDNGALSITGALDAGAGTVDLELTGTLDEGSPSVTGSIIAATLTGTSIGGASLTGANMIGAVNGFANTTGGGFTLFDGRALDVTGSIDAGAGDLTLETTGGSANGIVLNANLIAGTASGTQTVTLTSAGVIVQTGGAITAGTLTGSSVGGTTLNGANSIGSLANFTNAASGGFALTDSHALTLSGTLDNRVGSSTLTTTGVGSNLVISGTIKANGHTLTTISSGAIDESTGTITAATLTGSSVGGALFTGGANAINTLAGFNAGAGFSLVDDPTLIVSLDINSGTGDLTLTTTGGNGIVVNANLVAGAVAGTQRITLNSAGDFIQNNGTLQASTVNISAGGNLLIGEKAFTDLVALIDPNQINQTGLPFFTHSLAFTDHVFISARTVSFTAPERIVMENTGNLPTDPVYAPAGFSLNHTGTLPVAILIGGSPQVVDIFGNLIQNGLPVDPRSIATTTQVEFAPGTIASNHYFVNGCIVHQTGVCTIVSFDFKGFEPAKLAELVLASASSNEDVEEDLTITGAGNDEIWAEQ